MPRKVKEIFAIFLCLSFLLNQSGFAQVAGELDISGHLLQLRNSLIQDKFRPLHLRYLSYDALNNNFRLLLDKGDFNQGQSPFVSTQGLKGADPEERLKKETRVLLHYFFIGISLPNSSFWVNLRPDSPNNIIDDDLAQTDIGKILLEQDLQLKKDTAKFTSPETPAGKEYWDKLYKKAEELFGSENITIPTLTRPWIVPDEIIIRETPENAYIYKATLKVMLEEDYLAKGQSPAGTVPEASLYSFKDPRLKALNEYSSQLIRELIIPKLSKDINTAKRYASLRQVYYSLILAQWFKQRFYGKGGLYSWLIDQKNLNGLTSKEPWSKTTYFKEYQMSFQQGEYNIKEPIYTPVGQIIRSYMSGGMNLAVTMPPPAKLGEASQSAATPVTIIGANPTRNAPRGNNIIGISVTGGNIDGLGAPRVEIEGGQLTPSSFSNKVKPPASSPVEPRIFRNEREVEAHRATLAKMDEWLAEELSRRYVDWLYALRVMTELGLTKDATALQALNYPTFLQEVDKKDLLLVIDNYLSPAISSQKIANIDKLTVEDSRIALFGVGGFRDRGAFLEHSTSSGALVIEMYLFSGDNPYKFIAPSFREIEEQSGEQKRRFILHNISTEARGDTFYAYYSEDYYYVRLEVLEGLFKAHVITVPSAISLFERWRRLREISKKAESFVQEKSKLYGYPWLATLKRAIDEFPADRIKNIWPQGYTMAPSRTQLYIDGLKILSRQINRTLNRYRREIEAGLPDIEQQALLRRLAKGFHFGVPKSKLPPTDSASSPLAEPKKAVSSPMSEATSLSSDGTAKPIDVTTPSGILRIPKFSGKITLFKIHPHPEEETAALLIEEFLRGQGLLSKAEILRFTLAFEVKDDVSARVRQSTGINRFILTGRDCGLCVKEAFEAIINTKDGGADTPNIEIHLPFSATDVKNVSPERRKAYSEGKNGYKEYLEKAQVNYVLFYDGTVIASKIISSQGQEAKIVVRFWSSLDAMAAYLIESVSSPLAEKDDSLGKCVTADTLLPIVRLAEIPISKSQIPNKNIEFKPIVKVKPGDYVLSLNEESQTIEPHKIKGLLDMGVKPVFKLTTASGHSIKTTANHPYLTAKGWVKVSALKPGDEIACPVDAKHLDGRVLSENLSSAIGIFASVNSVNNNHRALKVKTDAIFSDSESMGGGWQINQGFGKREGPSRRHIQVNLFSDAFLQLPRQFIEFSFARRSKFNYCKHYFNQANPSFCLIFSKGTKPNLLASSMPFLSFEVNLGLMGRCASMASISQPTGLWNIYSLLDTYFSNLSSNAQSRSQSEYVSNTKYLGEPALSTTTAALKSLGKASPNFLNSSLETLVNFSSDSAFTSCFADNLTIDLVPIFLPPNKKKYNTLSLILSRLFLPEAETAPTTDSAIMWDKIVSIEPHRIKGLLDMGVKPVYKLTTASGHSIKTTANHPYLTNKGWVKLSGLKVGDEIACTVDAKHLDGRVLRGINARVLSLPDDVTLGMLLQEGPLELLKPPLLFPLFLTSFFGENQYTSKDEKDTQNADGNSPENRKFFKKITSQTYDKDSLTQISYRFGNKFYLVFMQWLHPQQIYHNLINLSRLFILKAEAAAVTDPAIFWDRIVSIEPLGYQQVYDIEVEGTHNFIGNGIFAHNTYIQSDQLPVASDQKKEAASSPMDGTVEDLKNPGGIDLRGLPIVTEPISGRVGRAGLNLPYQVSVGTVPVANLDAEWRQIENMAQSGLIPSNERIREYLQAACQTEDCSRRIDKVLSLLADILRLEEERVSSTEPALREFLVLLESDKSAQDLQVALSKIEVAPKEPELVEP